MTNWWPTPMVRWDNRIAPEFVYLWCGLLGWIYFRGQPSNTWLRLLAVTYCVLIFGRYLDTTAPALFGRAINLYWDGWQIPRLLWVLSKKHPLWMSLGVLTVACLGCYALYRLIHWAWRSAAVQAAPLALRSYPVLMLSAFLLVSSVANLFGAKFTWPYISRPVIPTYIQQSKILWEALREQQGESSLPASPAFTSDLKRLVGADFKMFVWESYGAMTYDNAQVKQALQPVRNELQVQISKSGLFVVSAMVTSPTFGGGSDLAHMAMLTGIDTRDPIRHDILLTSQRPTLTKHFKSHGYEIIGFYPGTDWDWPESKFFGFDKLLDGRHINYQGPKLGYWKIPDQVALAKLKENFPVQIGGKPRMTFFTSSTSHFPFHPVPPIQNDWSRLLTSKPYDEDSLNTAQNKPVQWLNMVPAYTDMMKYNHQTLSRYIAQKHARDYVMLVFGDHQPAASVTGEGASWDVPVHIIASNQQLLERFIAKGFSAGLLPNRKAIATMPELTGLLLDAFDSQK